MGESLNNQLSSKWGCTCWSSSGGQYSIPHYRSIPRRKISPPGRCIPKNIVGSSCECIWNWWWLYVWQVQFINCRGVPSLRPCSPYGTNEVLSGQGTRNLWGSCVWCSYPRRLAYTCPWELRSDFFFLRQSLTRSSSECGLRRIASRWDLWCCSIFCTCNSRRRCPCLRIRWWIYFCTGWLSDNCVRNGYWTAWSNNCFKVNILVH